MIRGSNGFFSNEKVVLGVISLLSAIIGGGLTSIISPMVKTKLEEKVIETERKRDLIKEWRNMVLEVNSKATYDNEVGQLVQDHPAYLTLEPFLSDEVRSLLYRDNRTIIVGNSLPKPLEDLKHEISKIESNWKLRR